MSQIIVRDHEPFDSALRRFKRLVERTGTLKQLRDKEFHETPAAARKRMKAAAIKRHRKALAGLALPKRLF